MKKLLFLILFLPLFVFGQDRVGSSGIKKTQNVALLDQTTDAVIFKFNKIAESTTLAEATILNSNKLVLADTTGVGQNTYIIVFSPITERIYKGYVLSVSVDTLTMDTPLDSEFPIGAFVDLTTTNFMVDGSSTTQTFGLRGVSPSPVGVTVDITRLIFHCQTGTAIDLAKFGDIDGGLTNGLVLRVRDGRNFNVFNVKTNGELAALMFDFNARAATNPQQGVDGFLSRMTFAGQNKIGVAIRLVPGDDLEFIIQDDLTSLDLFEVTAEGHIVED